MAVKRISRKKAGKRVAAQKGKQVAKARYIEMEFTRGGKRERVHSRAGFGYMIPAFTKADSFAEISSLVESGNALKYADVQPVIEFIGLKAPDTARAIGVSPRTLARWKLNSSIGKFGTHQFLKIDEVIKKGVDVFGNLEDLKAWLDSPNLVLGNVRPADLVTTQLGVDQVDEALDALKFGNVM